MRRKCEHNTQLRTSNHYFARIFSLFMFKHVQLVLCFYFRRRTQKGLKKRVFETITTMYSTTRAISMMVNIAAITDFKSELYI